MHVSRQTLRPFLTGLKANCGGVLGGRHYSKIDDFPGEDGFRRWNKKLNDVHPSYPGYNPIHEHMMYHTDRFLRENKAPDDLNTQLEALSAVDREIDRSIQAVDGRIGEAKVTGSALRNSMSSVEQVLAQAVHLREQGNRETERRFSAVQDHVNELDKAVDNAVLEIDKKREGKREAFMFSMKSIEYRMREIDRRLRDLGGKNNKEGEGNAY